MGKACGQCLKVLVIMTNVALKVKGKGNLLDRKLIIGIWKGIQVLGKLPSFTVYQFSLILARVL